MNLEDTKIKLKHDRNKYYDLLKNTEIDYMRHYYQGKIDYIEEVLALLPLTPEEEKELYEF